VSVAEWRFWSGHESTYFSASEHARGGPRILIKSKEEIVLVVSKALVGLMIKFICDNPHSHSLDEIGIILRAHFNCFSTSITVFSIRCSWNPRIVCLLFNWIRIDSFLTTFTPNVSWALMSSSQCFLSSSRAHAAKSAFWLSSSYFLSSLSTSCRKLLDRMENNFCNLSHEE
jgi:hypothetical protein